MTSYLSILGRSACTTSTAGLLPQISIHSVQDVIVEGEAVAFRVQRLGSLAACSVGWQLVATGLSISGATTGTLNFALGDVEKILTVTTVSQSGVQADLTLSVLLVNPVDCLVAVSAASILVIDAGLDPLPQVSAAAVAASITEGGVALFNVIRRTNIGPCSVNWSVAAPGADLTGATTSGTISWALRDDLPDRQIAVPTVAQAGTQSTATMTFTLSSPTNCTITTGADVATTDVLDNGEGALPSLAVSNDAASYVEGETAAFTVTKTGAGATTVVWAAAAPGASLLDTSGTLSFASGDTTKAISVRTVPQGGTQATATLTVTLSNPSAATLSTAADTCTITDNGKTAQTNCRLDGFPLPIGAWGLEHLLSSWGGPLCRIKRASDNAELDLYANLARELHESDVSTFGSGTSCKVIKWYDQTGQGRHMTLTDSADPGLLLYNSGFLRAEGGKAVAQATGATNGYQCAFTSALSGTDFAAICSAKVVGTTEHVLAFASEAGKSAVSGDNNSVVACRAETTTKWAISRGATQRSITMTGGMGFDTTLTWLIPSIVGGGITVRIETGSVTDTDLASVTLSLAHALMGDDSVTGSATAARCYASGSQFGAAMAWLGTMPTTGQLAGIQDAEATYWDAAPNGSPPSPPANTIDATNLNAPPIDTLISSVLIDVSNNVTGSSAWRIVPSTGITQPSGNLDSATIESDTTIRYTRNGQAAGSYTMTYTVQLVSAPATTDTATITIVVTQASEFSVIVRPTLAAFAAYDGTGVTGRTYDFSATTNRTLNGKQIIGFGTSSYGATEAELAYPITFRDSQDNFRIYGGKLWGEMPESTTWSTLKAGFDGDGILVKVFAGRVLVERFWAKNVMDGFSFPAGARQPNRIWTVRDCYIGSCRDDFIENDHVVNGNVINCLFENGYMGFSCRPGGAESGHGLGINPTLRLLDSLVHLRRDAQGQIAGLFKWSGFDPSTSGTVWATNCIFKVDAASNTGSAPMVFPPGIYENCQLIFLGSGAYPSPVPAGVTESKTTSIWTNARNAWLSAHGLDSSGDFTTWP